MKLLLETINLLNAKVTAMEIILARVNSISRRTFKKGCFDTDTGVRSFVFQESGARNVEEVRTIQKLFYAKRCFMQTSSTPTTTLLIIALKPE